MRYIQHKFSDQSVKSFQFVSVNSTIIFDYTSNKRCDYYRINNKSTSTSYMRISFKFVAERLRCRVFLPRVSGQFGGWINLPVE